jgi:ABC-2 type transport system permease protein
MRSETRLRETWRSFRIAAWLGWQIESNWADPLVFAIYSVIKPIAGALILVFMYAVIARGGLENPLFPAIFVGNAFFIYVPTVLSGISWSIIDDREHYGMLKYMYAAPLNIFAYLTGRGVAKAIIASIALVITLLLGIYALHVPVSFGAIDWPFFLALCICGAAVLTFLGILLGGVTLVTARHSYYVGEAVAGALYLLCGVVFPLDVLPTWVRWIGQAIPLTYWIEAIRRAMIGTGASQTLSGLSDSALLGITAGSALALAFVSYAVYRLAEYRARRLGLIDMQTMY